MCEEKSFIVFVWFSVWRWMEERATHKKHKRCWRGEAKNDLKHWNGECKNRNAQKVFAAKYPVWMTKIETMQWADYYQRLFGQKPTQLCTCHLTWMELWTHRSHTIHHRVHQGPLNFQHEIVALGIEWLEIKLIELNSLFSKLVVWMEMKKSWISFTNELDSIPFNMRIELNFGIYFNSRGITSRKKMSSKSL